MSDTLMPPDEVMKAAAGLTHTPEIILFEHANFDGDQFRTNVGFSFSQGHPWNDRTSSVIVVSGRWSLFVDRDLTGQSSTLGPGYYPTPESTGIPNDTLTSFQMVAW